MKRKDLTGKPCVFICYFTDLVVKIVLSEAATGGVLYKKVFLKFKIFTGKHKARTSAGTAAVFTCHLNLKISEHTL